MAHSRSETPNDPYVAISPKLAAKAYDAFAATGALAKDHELDGRLRETIELLGKSVELGERWVLGNRQTISNWRKHLLRRPLFRKLSVIESLMAIVGIDISFDGVLGGRPLYLLDAVRLYQTKLRKLSNQPDKNGDETYSIELSGAVFKQTQLSVSSIWLAGKGGKSLNVGRFGLGVSEVAVSIEESEGIISNPIRILEPSEISERGTATGCVLIWDPGENRWIVQGTGLGSMRGSLQDVVLGEISIPPNSRKNLFLTVSMEHLEPTFAQEEVSEDKLDEVRAKIFSQVLKFRHLQFAVLAFQNLEAT